MGARKLLGSSSREGDPTILRNVSVEKCREPGISNDAIRTFGFLNKLVRYVKTGRDTYSLFKGDQESSERVMKYDMRSFCVDRLILMLRKLGRFIHIVEPCKYAFVSVAK